MNRGWSFYIAIVALANIAACLWLLWWTARKRPDDKPETGTTGHVWDGDITELNRPMPRWWLNLFYLTVVFGVAYLIVYPGLGAFAGMKGWSSEQELRDDALAADAKLRPLFARFAQTPLPELAGNAEAQKLGRSIFANHCTTCHGSDARGAKGFPNLTDGDWIWGESPETVLATILDGRQAVMPPLGMVLGEAGVQQAAVYVQQLSGTRVDPALAAAGKARFDALCAACHGADGKGNQVLGAPNLTDAVWLYGGDFESLVQSIADGRQGQMPAHRDILGTDRVRLAAAWVLGQRPAAQAH